MPACFGAVVRLGRRQVAGSAGTSLPSPSSMPPLNLDVQQCTPTPDRRHGEGETQLAGILGVLAGMGVMEAVSRRSVTSPGRHHALAAGE
ncbi:hypothetical protein E2C01_072867 [Portunus trituberculatus]|uniref:Uncharacterized protein n=1 Tax=Portunus trituberculatus TaxID=210409 RepID=A0A5B7HZ76_PORTR|nr:hypothetical protein [Portunus trituberculatus]